MKGGPAECRVAEERRAEEWIVKGSGDAHGAIDLVCLKRGERPQVVQVKGNREGGPYKNFGRGKREEIRREAEQADADALLAYSPSKARPVQWIPEALWPR